MENRINLIISSLRRIIACIELLEPKHIINCSEPVYGSSIGDHFNHILSFLIFLNSKNIAKKELDFTKRTKKYIDESLFKKDGQFKKEILLDSFNLVIDNLRQLPNEFSLEHNVVILDENGMTSTSVGSLLRESKDHITHHIALVIFVLNHHMCLKQIKILKEVSYNESIIIRK